MKKQLLLIGLLSLCMLAGCHHNTKEEPYNRHAQADEYERNFRSNIFASCLLEGKFDAMYSLAHLDAKPTKCNPRYKVTFVNGPCKGKTIFTTDVIEKTAPIDGGQLVKGDVVLRNYWNPRKQINDTDSLDRWHRGVVYDTSRADKGIIELEFPHDKNDFMAPREFIFLHNVHNIQKPVSKDPRTWL